MSEKRRFPVRRVLLPLVLIAAIAALAWFRPWAGDSVDPDRLYGNVDVREVQLAFRVGGRLVSVDVDEGDAITAGQVVARLDDAPFREALAVADAQLDEARAQLERVLAGARPEEIQQARAAVRSAQALYDNAERDFTRQQRLITSGSTSQTSLDAARSARDTTQAQLASAEEALALAEAGARTEDVTAARAAVAVAEARRAQAASTLADATLSTPSDGTVSVRAREPGAMVTTGQPVVSITLNDAVYVRAYIDEPRLSRVSPGSAVTLEVDGRDTAYHGHIGFVSPRAEFTPRQVETTDLRTSLVYRVRILVDDADDGLRQGMPVTVVLPGTAAAAAPIVAQ